jgi:pimeloyl-ACP methyl ester carboxylesterase
VTVQADAPTSLISLGGVTFECTRIGQGIPLLVNSPSWWSLNPWRVRFAEVLGRDFELILWNHRGIGRTDATPDGYTGSQFAADAAALATALGFSRVHAVGFAQGGHTTLVMARDFPHLVASATVAGAGGRNAPEDLETQQQRVRDAITRHGYEGYHRSHAAESPMAFSPEFAEENVALREALGDALWQGHGTQETFMNHVAARSTFDQGDWMERLQTPVLVAVGGEDRAYRGSSTPVDVAHELTQRLPNARLRVFPKARHFMLWETTEQFAAELRSFVAGVDRGTPVSP